MSVQTQIQKLPATSSPTFIQRIGLFAFRKYIERWQEGGIQITLPDGTCQEWPEQPLLSRSIMHVHDWRFFNQLLWDEDIGLGHAHTLGYWSSPHLDRLLLDFCKNLRAGEDNQSPWKTWGKWSQLLWHKARKNTLRGSAKNISAHYDLGNSFYAQFLDKEMVYSSAFYKHSNESLEQAQANKIELILGKLKLQPGQKLLEIGSGWGALAITAAKKYACQVTTVTLSKEQFTWAQRRIKEENLELMVEIKLQDYRTLEGQFDRIVSVEMMEALGHEFLPVFYMHCNKLLKDDGLMAVQVITMPDDRYNAYRKSCDWIQRYIFPGAVCPSLEVLGKAQKESSNLSLIHSENIASHYAKTLNSWYERFEKNWEGIEPLGFDLSFRRLWRYYLRYCEAGFASNYLGTYQLLYTKNS